MEENQDKICFFFEMYISEVKGGDLMVAERLNGRHIRNGCGWDDCARCASASKCDQYKSLWTDGFATFESYEDAVNGRALY